MRHVGREGWHAGAGQQAPHRLIQDGGAGAPRQVYLQDRTIARHGEADMAAALLAKRSGGLGV